MLEKGQSRGPGYCKSFSVDLQKREGDKISFDGIDPRVAKFRNNYDWGGRPTTQSS